MDRIEIIMEHQQNIYKALGKMRRGETVPREDIEAVLEAVVYIFGEMEREEWERRRK